ncbi:hypothetical protein ACGFSB_18240 [Streptomyces sp. NPDC048441]|uniref:hypothetical protein n=1 Tax=Streptomyces sp. NPDC048441 TaxID=3365552 RepID=UPI003715DB32
MTNGNPRGGKQVRHSGRRLRAAGFACLVLVIAILVSAALALGPYTWAGEMWRALAPGWPGKGYGFAITAGVLLPVAGVLAFRPFLRVNWKRDKVRSALWTAAALPGASAAVMTLAIAMHTARPKRSHRNGYCSASGEYCWVSQNYPYVWAVGLTATVLAAGMGLWLHSVYDGRRTTKPASAAGTPSA